MEHSAERLVFQMYEIERTLKRLQQLERDAAQHCDLMARTIGSEVGGKHTTQQQPLALKNQTPANVSVCVCVCVCVCDNNESNSQCQVKKEHNNNIIFLVFLPGFSGLCQRG